MAIRRTQIERPGERWTRAADRAVERWDHLDSEERERLLEQAWTLDRTRSWEGLGGLSVTDSMRATITAQACLLTVNIGLPMLKDLTSILVAGPVAARRTRHLVGGSVVVEANSHVSGETLLHGPLRLAWNQVVMDMRPGSGTSVILHEFAHKLDMADGTIDGNPPLFSRDATAEFDRVAEAVLDVIRMGDSAAPLRDYAATNRSELFAVATETFFLRPVELRTSFTDLYQALAASYRQDPAAGPPGGSTP
jgi:MtfA peptidase